MEPNHRNRRLARAVRYALIILGVIFLVLIVFAVMQYRALRRAQVINAREFFITSLIQRHGPLTANEAALIRPWMTFDYLNRIFNLPADYLKTQLSIADPHYPQLSLGGYARSGHLDPNVFLGQVETAVRAYLITQ
ncbi:MAG: hypothetical protein ABSE18_02420 [Minisyncoccia bacterium]|jgi:hypothetical protein